MERIETLLDACNDLHEGKDEAAIQRIMEALPCFPELARSNIVLPSIRRAADKSEVGRCAFEQMHPRPQLVEALNAPLTWINGARVGVWNVLEATNPYDFSARDPRFLIVTGTGPREIRSRLVPIITDLASERNCASDLVLSGFARFDLREGGAAQHEQSWSPTEFCDAVVALANSLAVSEVVDVVGRDYIVMLAPQVLRPTVRMAQQDFQGIEQEIGFVVNQDIDLDLFQKAEGGLAGAVEAMTEQSPILAEYKRKGKPIEVDLDEAFLGLEEYKKVTGAYTQAVRRQRVEEWERRRSLYEGWALGTVQEWHLLRRMDPAERETYSTLIHWAVNFETASRERLDPPRRVSGSERLASLPHFIVDNLAWWALAKHRIEVVSTERDFQPWMDSYLVDAFLRGQPQPERDKDLKQAYDRWLCEWRPIALHALDAALRKQGSKLVEIAVEQTLFQVVRKTDSRFTLRVLHVWDASLDSVPTISDTAVTLYSPRFAARKETFLSGREAQRAAVQKLDAAMESLPIESKHVTEALALDSGEAIDRLLNRLAKHLQKEGMEREITMIRDVAVATDPFLKCRFSKKLNNHTDLPGLIRIAADLGAESSRKDAVPDLRAWELYLALESVRQVIANLASDLNRLQMLAWNEIQLIPGLYGRRDPESILALSSLTAWQILEAAGQAGPKRDVVNSILLALQSSYTAERLLKANADFRARYPSYADRCTATDGPPPRSEELEERSAPNCFRGWKEVCYYLALGDAAAALGNILLPASDNPSQESLTETLTQLEAHEIHDSFPDLFGRRQKLIAEVEPYLAKGDIVSVDFATSKIRTVLSACLDEAAAAYTAAALRDGQYGAGWIRLAALKWSLGSYRDALRCLIGPAPTVNLLAARFPLALAVRLAGGYVEAHAEKGEKWTSPEPLLCTAEDEETSGSVTVEVFRAYHPPRKIGRCIVSGLEKADAQMLVDFFRKYDASLLRSAGRRSFEDWISLAQVPSLGRWGSLAAACEQGAELPVLMAGVYLGVPGALRCASVQEIPSRPSAWLDGDVVTSLNW